MSNRLSLASKKKVLEAENLVSQAVSLIASMPDSQFEQYKKMFKEGNKKSVYLSIDALPITSLIDIRDALHNSIK